MTSHTQSPGLEVATGAEPIRLLDGGAEAFPRMLSAIRAARERVHLEVYAFSREGVGQQFVTALTEAAARGVKVKVIVDGWGTVGNSGALRATLRAAGARVRIYNPLSSLFSGRAWRNHRKILLVDEAVAFVGGINIGDEYAADGERPGWADLALELRGEICRRLALRLNAGPSEVEAGPVRISLSGFGGGRRLRARYLKSISDARQSVVLAHAYFLPNMSFVHAVKRAARRGVKVTLLLAGRSDVAFARAATMRLYRTFLQAGVHIFEWGDSTLHAKAALVDGEHLMVGSFNLDPLSLVNLETLVEVQGGHEVVHQAGAWLERHLAKSRRVVIDDCARTGLQRWLLDVLGLAAARFAEGFARFLGARRRRAP